MLSFTLIYDDYLLMFNVTILLRTLWPWLARTTQYSLRPSRVSSIRVVYVAVVIDDL